MLEREIKLRFSTTDEARLAIIATGASLLHPRRLQDDALFDAADENLRRRGCALRVRRENGTTLLTFKGPVQPDAVMKTREEHETPVTDAAVIHRILAELGYRPWFRYQKYREEFARGDVTIALDETPIGTFVELEGSEQGIIAAVQALGRTTADGIRDSYRSLFLRHREACGLRGDHMIFPGA